MAVDKNKISAEAMRLVQKGQLDKAIRCYERILAQDPADVRVLLKVGELQQKKGDARAAAATFERCAEAYAEQGFLLKSVAVYKQIVKLAPDEARVSERLAALYQQLGLVSEAMGQLQLVAGAAERAGNEPMLLDVLRRIVDLDPENVASSVKLGETYVRLGQPKIATEHLTRAAAQLKRNSRIDEYLRVAERIAGLVPDDWPLARELASILLARGDAKSALLRLQPCFKADPKNVETLTLLAHAFQDLGQTPKLTSVYRELARIHADARDLEASRGAWRRVQELAPDDADAAEALGGGTAPEAATPTSAAEVTATTAAWGVTPPSQAWGLPPETATAVTSSASITAPAAPPTPQAVAAASPTGDLAAAQPTSAAPAAAAGVDAGRIFVEVDVYLKYGLHEKALEHLQKLLAEQPDHLDGREKASQIREQRNDLPGAADESLRAARAALAAGLAARARSAFDRARSLAPAHAGLAELAVAVHAEPIAETPARSEEFVLEIDDSALAEPVSGGTARADEDELALTAAVRESEEVVEEPAPVEAAARPEGEIAAAQSSPEPAPPPGPAPDERAPAPLGEPIEAEAVGEPEPRAAGAASAEALGEELAEVDFFITQGLLDEARALLAEIEAAHPAHPALAGRIRDLQQAAGAGSGARNEAPTAPGPAGGDYLYSVRDVLEPFKKGVERALTVEDADTHYDLGIAYREMGLLEDAIQEFEQALRGGDAPKRVDALTMIGLCRGESGELAGSIEAYRRALRVEGIGADRRRAVEHQLAGAYEAAGDRDAALWYLQRIVAEDPGYRDARVALARLGGGSGRAPAEEARPGGGEEGAAGADRAGTGGVLVADGTQGRPA